MECSEGVMEKRLLKRAETSGREDNDSVETIKNRIATYKEHTEPVLEFFQRSNRAKKIDADSDVDSIFTNVAIALDDILYRIEQPLVGTLHSVAATTTAWQSLSASKKHREKRKKHKKKKHKKHKKKSESGSAHGSAHNSSRSSAHSESHASLPNDNASELAAVWATGDKKMEASRPKSEREMSNQDHATPVTPPKTSESKQGSNRENDAAQQNIAADVHEAASSEEPEAPANDNMEPASALEDMATPTAVEKLASEPLKLPAELLVAAEGEPAATTEEPQTAVEEAPSTAVEEDPSATVEEEPLGAAEEQPLVTANEELALAAEAADANDGLSETSDDVGRLYHMSEAMERQSIPAATAAANIIAASDIDVSSHSEPNGVGGIFTTYNIPEGGDEAEAQFRATISKMPFDKSELMFLGNADTKDKIQAVWKKMEVSQDHMVHYPEFKKYMRTFHSAMKADVGLKLAYGATCAAAGNSDGISKKRFPQLIANAAFVRKLLRCFAMLHPRYTAADETKFLSTKELAQGFDGSTIEFGLAKLGLEVARPEIGRYIFDRMAFGSDDALLDFEKFYSHVCESGFDVPTSWPPIKKAKKKKKRKSLVTSPSKVMTEPAPKGRRITMWRNGDAHFAGKMVVVKDRDVETLSLVEFLSTISGKFYPFGPLEVVYQIGRNGEDDQVYMLDTVKELMEGGKYVVAKRSQRYRKVKYEEILGNENLEHNEHMKNEKRVAAKKAAIRSRVGNVKIVDQVKTIFLKRNGDKEQNWARLTMTGRNAINMDQVLQRVQGKLKLKNACECICTRDGKNIQKVSDIETGETYIAVEMRRPWRSLNYEKVTPARPIKSSPIPRIPTPEEVLESTTIPEEPEPIVLAKEPAMVKEATPVPPIASDGDEPEAIETESAPAPAPALKQINYAINVTTSDITNAGTTGEVWVQLKGAAGTTNWQEISPDEDGGFAKAGSTLVCNLVANDVYEIANMELKVIARNPGVDGGGTDEVPAPSSWHVSKVVCRGAVGAPNVTYPFNKWIHPAKDGTCPIVACKSPKLIEDVEEHAEVGVWHDDFKTARRLWKKIDVKAVGSAEIAEVNTIISDPHEPLLGAHASVETCHLWFKEHGSGPANETKVAKADFPFYFSLIVHASNLGHRLGNAAMPASKVVKLADTVTAIRSLWPDGPHATEVEEMFQPLVIVDDNGNDEASTLQFVDAAKKYAMLRAEESFARKKKEKKEKKEQKKEHKKHKKHHKKKGERSDAKDGYAPKHVLYDQDEIEVLRAIRNPVMIKQFWTELGAGHDTSGDGFQRQGKKLSPEEKEATEGTDAVGQGEASTPGEQAEAVSDVGSVDEKSARHDGSVSYRVVLNFCKKTFPSLLENDVAASRALMVSLGEQDVEDDIETSQLTVEQFKEFMMNAFYYSRVLSSIPKGDDTLTLPQFQQLTVDIRANMGDGEDAKAFAKLTTPELGIVQDTDEDGEPIVEVDKVVNWFRDMSEDQSLRDAIPNISSIGFSEAEQELLAICEEPSQLALLWRKIDTNHNGKISFMELKG